MSLRSKILKNRYGFRRKHAHFGVFLNPEVQTETIPAGGRASFQFIVENDSEKPVTLRAEVQQLSLGWLSTLERSDPNIRADEAFWLEPGERAHYRLVLKPARSLQAGEGQALLTLVDVNNPTMTASARAIVRIGTEKPDTGQTGAGTSGSGEQQS